LLDVFFAIVEGVIQIDLLLFVQTVSDGLVELDSSISDYVLLYVVFADFVFDCQERVFFE
jgi:hypothetical protein